MSTSEGNQDTSLLSQDQPLKSLNHALPEVPEPCPSDENVPSTPASPAHPGSASGTSKPASPLQTIFRAYTKFGDTKADGKAISLSQSDKWMKQAKVIDGKKITTTDTGIYFKKLKHQKLAFPDYLKFLEDLAKNKKVDLEEIKTKLVDGGPPAVAGTTAAVKSSAVDRLTDSAKFTGSHKQRFDSAGRGRGTEGRKDAPGAGYVSGYTNKDTYDSTH